MATFTAYGTNYTIADNPTPSTLLESAKLFGKVRAVTEKVVMTTAADATSIVYIGKLPKGAIPLFTIFECDDTTATTHISIGYSGDTDALGTATDIKDLGTALIQPTVWNTPLTEDKDVYVTTSEGATSASTNWYTTIIYASSN